MDRSTERGTEGGRGGEESRDQSRYLGCLRKKQLIMVCVCAGILLVLFTIVTAVVVTQNSGPHPLHWFSTGGDMLDFLVQTGDITEKDALLATWYHRANNQSEMNTALRSDIMILEADVTVQGLNTANETTLPIMAHPPHVYSDNTLNQWLDAVLKSRKGVKLDFKSLKAVGPSLDLLKEKNRTSGLNRPIWINADILHGPNVPGFYPVVNGSSFLSLVQQKFPEVTLSPGWAVLYVPQFPNVTYTQAMVEKMYDIIRLAPQPITFPIYVLMARSGWPHIAWLLSQSPRFSLTLWQGNVNPSVEDLLFIRDNSHPRRVYYDIYEPILSNFKQAANQRGRVRRFYPGGDLHDYFLSKHRDGRDILWHNVRDSASLESLLAGDHGGMLVITVGFVPEQPGVPVLEGSGSAPVFSLWACLDRVLSSSGLWGFYLRVGNRDVLEGSLRVLSELYDRNRLYRPVWVNMALSQGCFSTQGYISGEAYLATVNQVFSHITLAPSWPPEALEEGYTTPLVRDMEVLLEGAWQGVALQVGAEPLGRSGKGLKGLQSKYSLIVEEGVERGRIIEEEGKEQIVRTLRQVSRKRRVYCTPDQYRTRIYMDMDQS
ncbi:protein FAM151A [Osmerus eperlanus]|uniref:protein FAM151A n=1 Tax=Osmerus eperlanus TaxID=29151 RepID=UPI002E1377A2